MCSLLMEKILFLCPSCKVASGYGYISSMERADR